MLQVFVEHPFKHVSGQVGVEQDPPVVEAIQEQRDPQFIVVLQYGLHVPPLQLRLEHPFKHVELQ